MNLTNRTIYIYDNLPVLRGIDSDSVDLIATDPPFNSGRVFKGTDGQILNDSWDWIPEYTEWLDTYPNRKVVEVVESALHAHSRGLAAYLCFMGERLVEMERVLKNHGTIYLHCDDRASHYLKVMMDAIWGEARFMADIVWERAKDDKPGSNWGRNHDNLLVYGSGRIDKEAIKRPLKDSNISVNYCHSDEHGSYRHSDLTAPSKDGGWKWRGISPGARRRFTAPGALPKHFQKPEGYDRWEVVQKLEELDRQKLVYWPMNKGVPSFKRYLSTNTGEAPTNVWTDINPLASNSRARKQANHWTTQKPVPLYERIVLASSKPGDMVLDPFCGCATTCIAAEIHARQWVGIEEAKQVYQAMTGYMKAATGERNLFADPIEINTPPKRTDGGDFTPQLVGPKPRKVQMPKETWNAHRERLAQRHGNTCQGCKTIMPALRHLELDHIIPKALHLEWNPETPDDVINHPTNLTLMCSHCNRVKGDRLSLADLRALQASRI